MLLIAGITFVASTSLAGEASRASEEWFRMTFHGRKIGFVRARSEPVTVNNKEVIHLERWSVITVRRQDNVVRMEHTLDLWFEPNGRPIRYELIRKEGGEIRKGEGHWEGQEFLVTQTVGGNKRTKRHQLKADDRLASSLEWLHLRKIIPGGKFTGRSIDETEGDLLPFTISIAEKPKTDDTKVYVVNQILGPLESVSEVHKSNGFLRTELKGTGMVVERASKDDAISSAEYVDIFSAALFPVDEDLPSRDKIKSLTLFFGTDRDRGLTIPAFERQEVSVNNPKQVHVKLLAASEPVQSSSLPIQTKSVVNYLSATDYENTSDPKLIAASKQAVAGAKDAWTAARRINRFVNQHLENKTLAHAFASASEAYTDKSGDCTEHAVLFSALAKIAGIPTKLVTGLVYVSGSNPSFGYHEWVEVWLGSRWHPMDPTFNQETADPTHVKFAEGMSDPTGIRQAGLAAASLIGDVQLSIAGVSTK